MFLETIAFFFIGTILGIFAGLIPGLHPNTIIVILLSLVPAVPGNMQYPVIALVVSMSVSNTVSNFIPSIFIGAPEPGTSLSVLPGHRMLMKGLGYEALFMTVCGGVFVVVLTIVGLPFLLWAIPLIYGNIHAYTSIILVSILVLLLLQESRRKAAYSLFIFFTSGTAGIILLSSIPSEQALFPALSGFFGVPILLTSMMMKVNFPKQRVGRRIRVNPVKGGVAGWISGLLVGILPGIGSSQAAVLSNTVLKGNDRDFLVSIGGINTANIIFTFIALHTISRTRSGAAVFISGLIGPLATTDMLIIVLLSALSCFLASLLTLYIARRFLHLMGRMNYMYINTASIAFISCLVAVFTGFHGLVIAAACTIIGLSCVQLGVKRMYLMGFLMLPTILFFAGIPIITIFM